MGLNVAAIQSKLPDGWVVSTPTHKFGVEVSRGDDCIGIRWVATVEPEPDDIAAVLRQWIAARERRT